MTSTDQTETGVGSSLARALRATGLDLDGVHRDRMRDAVERAARDAGVKTLADYAGLVQREPQAYGDLVDRLTVGETYFFREAAQIDLIRSIARTWADQPGSRRIWSAGCASGEEPYTVAILMEQAGLLDQCRIVGTDISEAALGRARAGAYSIWSLRRCDPAIRAAYFEERVDGCRLPGCLVDAVDFRLHNLMEGRPDGGPFDLVLCRNVLIYLRDDAVPVAAAVLRDALLPGGRLITGSGDPPLHVDGLELVRTDHGLVYHRAIHRGAAALTADRTRPLRPRPVVPAESFGPGRHGRARSESRSARTVPPPSRTTSATRLPTPQTAAPGPGPDELAATVSSLADAGRLADAEQVLAAAVADHPDDAGLRVLGAMLHLHAGRHADAAVAATAAVFLDPDLIVAHMLLGRAEQQRGRVAAARRSFLTAYELSARLPPDTEVPHTSGERAGVLAETAVTLAEAVNE